MRRFKVNLLWVTDGLETSVVALTLLLEMIGICDQYLRVVDVVRKELHLGIDVWRLNRFWKSCDYS